VFLYHFGFRRRVRAALGLIVLVLSAPSQARGQQGASQPGSISGVVRFQNSSEIVSGAVVLVTELRRSTKTNDEGRYEFRNVPPGTYTLLAQRDQLTTDRTVVSVAPGQAVSADFVLTLSTLHEEITVTATPTGEATTFEAFNSVTTLSSDELARTMGNNLGEALENQPGIAKRSFGPGSSRPVIRGFDGDRVLMMQDGVRTGDLSSQSPDHGVTIDPAGLSRVEVVKGPATLLYGSNAIGGVVNAITPQELFRANPFDGVFGQALVDLGSANAQTGGHGSVQVGRHGWLFWGGGGGRRTGDYGTPAGEVPNSASRLSSGSGGVAYAGQRAFFSAGAQLEDVRYGIPYAGLFEGGEEEEGPTDSGQEGEALAEVDIDGRRTDFRVDAGLRRLGTPFVESVRFAASYLDWRHDEIEIEDGVESIGTQFSNDIVVLRAEAEQASRGRLSGRFGLTTQWRDFIASGAEALAPATTQQTFAAFAYEQLDLGRHRIQFGARIERNAYDVADRQTEGEDNDESASGPPPVRDRSFVAFSGSLGLHRNIGNGGAFVVNLTRAVRAPALEELYNFGPHVGTLAFEIGNPDLVREASTGIEVSLRSRAGLLRGELNGFLYNIDDFVFLSFTGAEVGRLREAEFLQGDSRFAGFDAAGSVELARGAHLWLGAGYVSARLTDTDEWLPRIPPFHGRIELDIPWRSFRFSPELVLTARQSQTFRGETDTAGFSVLNATVSWQRTTAGATHTLTLRGYNLTDSLYRLHTSVIKDLAPELGRGVKMSYSLRFF